MGQRKKIKQLLDWNRNINASLQSYKPEEVLCSGCALMDPLPCPHHILSLESVCEEELWTHAYTILLSHHPSIQAPSM